MEEEKRHEREEIRAIMEQFLLDVQEEQDGDGEEDEEEEEEDVDRVNNSILMDMIRDNNSVGVDSFLKDHPQLVNFVSVFDFFSSFFFFLESPSKSLSSFSLFLFFF